MLSNENRRKIERRALEITAEIEAKAGPFYAEVVPGTEPQWHLIETFPFQEAKAVRYLVERQFGVFLPTFDKEASRLLDGVELCGGRRLIFPGHVFVFVWDIAHHWRRLRSCPGVARILMDQPEHPVIVPDQVIDKIQALQFGQSGFGVSAAPEKKMTRRQREKLAKLRREGKQDDTPDRIVLSTVSHWHDIEALAPEERISLLHRALGLEMLTPSGEEATVPS